MRRSPLAAAFAVLAVCLLLPAASQAAGFASDPFSSAAVEQFAAPDPALPAGFTDTTVYSGLVTPTAVRFAPDGRVFVAQKTASSTSTTASRTRPRPGTSTSAARSTTSAIAGCSAWRSTRSSRPAGRTSTCSTRTTGPARRASRRWNDNCPDSPGADSYGCPARGRLSRIDRRRHRDVLIQDWCTVTRRTRSATCASGLTARCTLLRATARPSRSPTTGRAAADPANPCGDPPAAGRRHRRRRRPRAGRCARRRSGARPASRDARRLDPPREPGHWRRDARQPGHWRRQRQPSPDRRLRLPQPVPLHVPPGHQRDWIGDVGWNTWEEINRLPTPRRSATSAGPATRATGSMGSYDTLNLDHLRERCTRRARPSAAVVHRTSTAAVANGTRLPGRHVSTDRHRVLHRTAFPAAVPQRAVRGRLRARLHLCDVRAGADGAPDPSTAAVFGDGADPGRHADGPGRGDLLRRHRRRDDPADRLPGGQPRADRARATATPTTARRR